MAMDRFLEIRRLWEETRQTPATTPEMNTVKRDFGYLVEEVERLRAIEDAALALKGKWPEFGTYLIGDINALCDALEQNPRPDGSHQS